MEPEVHYCTTDDGVRIAYSVEGDGQHAPLVFVPGWVSHLELDAQTRDSLRITEVLTTVRFITFDKRGTGLSSRAVSDFSLDAHLRDLVAVVDDVGLDRFALAGVSEGGPVALAFAARYPDRVTHLVIVGSYALGSRIAGSSAMNQVVLSAVKAEWDIGSQFLTDLFIDGDSWVPASAFSRYQRAAANPDAAYGALRSAIGLDVRSLLSKIRAPALVLHTRDDRVVPLEAGQEIAAGIRGSRFNRFPARISRHRRWQGNF